MGQQKFPKLSDAIPHENPTACTLLVASCDKYADLWRPFFSLNRIHWPDRPFPAALISEQLDPKFDDVRALCLGKGLDWSSLMIRALDAVDTPYVLLTLDDFFLRSAVDTARILRLLDDMEQHQLRMLRLIPRPGPTIRLAGVRDYGAIGANTPFRVSAQAAFWRVETLRQLLVPGESAWEFEVNGTKRSAEHQGFAAVWQAALPYRHHVIERGKWFPWAAWRFQRLNIGVDLSSRPVMTIRETARWLIGKTTVKVVQQLPQKWRRALRPLVRRCGWAV